MASAIVACGFAADPIAIPLIDLFGIAVVDGTVQVDPIDPTEWRFDGEGTIAIPETDDDIELDAYLDVFLNEEAEDLP